MVKIKCLKDEWVLVQRESYNTTLKKIDNSSIFYYATRDPYEPKPETSDDNGHAALLFVLDRVEAIKHYTAQDLYVRSNADSYIFVKNEIETTSRAIDNAVVGDDENNVALNKDQGVRLRGSSTVWKDMIMDLFGKRLESTVGKVDYDWEELALKFQSGGSIDVRNDRVVGNQEINHEFKVGKKLSFKPHLHWWQEVSGGQVTPFEFTLRYRLQRNGYTKSTVWTDIKCIMGQDDVFDLSTYPDGTYNQITVFSDIVVDCNISDTLQFMLARTDTESGDARAYFFDLHGEVDSTGSDDDFYKS